MQTNWTIQKKYTMDKFLETSNLPILSQEETENLNILITISEIEFFKIPEKIISTSLSMLYSLDHIEYKLLRLGALEGRASFHIFQYYPCFPRRTLRFKMFKGFSQSHLYSSQKRRHLGCVSQTSFMGRGRAHTAFSQDIKAKYKFLQFSCKCDMENTYK